MVSQISHLSLKMRFEVYDANSYCKGISPPLIIGGTDAMFLYFLVNSHCCSWRYFVLWEPGKLGAILFFLSVFIWIGELSKGFLVNKVDLLNSNSSFLSEHRNDLLREKHRKM